MTHPGDALAPGARFGARSRTPEPGAPHGTPAPLTDVVCAVEAAGNVGRACTTVLVPGRRLPTRPARFASPPRDTVSGDPPQRVGRGPQSQWEGPT